jgi:hypothetical protein
VLQVCVCCSCADDNVLPCLLCLLTHLQAVEESEGAVQQALTHLLAFTGIKVSHRTALSTHVRTYVPRHTHVRVRTYVYTHTHATHLTHRQLGSELYAPM